jgi:hypothetical protein
MLPIEENTLAILKWRLGKPAPPIAGAQCGSYIDLVSEVGGLGVDPGTIPPSSTAIPAAAARPPVPNRGMAAMITPSSRPRPARSVACYDRFGDFGLRSAHRYGGSVDISPRDEIERLVLEAWRERWWSVLAEHRQSATIKDSAPCRQDHLRARELRTARPRGRFDASWTGRAGALLNAQAIGRRRDPRPAHRAGNSWQQREPRRGHAGSRVSMRSVDGVWG